MEYKIISDGSCDLSDDLVSKYDIEVVPFYVSFDGEIYEKEKEEVAIRDFYEKMVKNPKVFPKSSLPSIIDYETVFTKYVEANLAIICICITTKFSGSYNSASNAKNMVLEKYPDAQITVIDATINTVLQGLYVIEAAKMKNDGLTYEETIDKLEEIKSTGRIIFTIGSIDYLKNGGRIGKVAGVAASALGLRPIIILREGEIFTGGIARSRSKSIAKVLEQIKVHFETIKEDPKDYSIAVGYGYDIEETKDFKRKVAELLSINENEIIVQQIGATIGVHTGPHPLGIGLIKKYNK